MRIRSLMPTAAAAVAALAAAAALLAGGAAPARAQFPTRPPAPLPLEPAQFPPFVDTLLTNGLRLVMVQNHKQPVLSVSLSVPAGSFFDPADKAGLAEMVAGLLTKGAGNRTADQISAAIEGVGGSLTAVAGSDFLTLSAVVLADDRQLAFDLLADAAFRPRFPAAEVDLLRTQTLSALTLERSQPEAIARRAFARGLYGDHPYGRRPTEATVRAITRQDLVTFHETHVRPSQGLLVVAGALDSADVHQMAEAAFSSWRGQAPTMPVPRPAPQRARSEIVLVHRAGSVQSNIVLGNTTWMPNDVRAYALTLANQVLGGASDSRLFQILREEKGWTYGAYSGVARSRFLGNFSATAEVRTEVTDSALVEMLAQVRRMGAEPVPADEFARQQQTLVGRFPLQIESAAQVAAQVATSRLLGLPADYVQTYRQRLAALTREQVQGAARGGMRADAALIVVVGDATRLAAPLAAVAPVRIVDVDGRPVSVGDLVVRAAPLAFDHARLRPASDSFAVLVQGNPFGFQVTSMARDGDGWRYREHSEIGPIIQQETEVRMSADLAMRSVSQEGSFQGSAMRLDVRYGEGTVSGTGMTPGPQGMQPVRYDALPVPAGTVDDNAVQALLPLLDWRPGASFTLAVFASGKGAMEQRTLRVVGEEAVVVPAGTFTAYRVEYTGGDATGTYWVESAAAHRVLKFGPAGAPVEFVRVR
jgi:zinc protease